VKKIIASIMLLIATSVSANEYKLILQNPVGTGADQVARALSKLVKEQSNITLVVNNISAGGGVLAAQQFKQEKLAVVLASTSMLIYGPLSGNELSKTYSIKDFDIGTGLGQTGSIWYTWTGSGINNANDLVRVLPTLPKSSIGVASQDTQANARALTKLKNLDVPVVMYKNHNEVAVTVAGKHIPVGVAVISTDSICALVDKGELKIIGYSGNLPLTFRGQNIEPISKTLNLPSFYGGVWVSLTPGDSADHRALKLAINKALQDKELQALIKQSWPLGNVLTFDQIDSIARQHQDLLK